MFETLSFVIFQISNSRCDTAVNDMAHSSISEEQQLREMRLALAAENEKKRRLADERLQLDMAYSNSETPAELKKLRQALEEKDATIRELRQQSGQLRSLDSGLPVHAEPRRLKPTEQAWSTKLIQYHYYHNSTERKHTIYRDAVAYVRVNLKIPPSYYDDSDLRKCCPARLDQPLAPFDREFMSTVARHHLPHEMWFDPEHNISAIFEEDAQKATVASFLTLAECELRKFSTAKSHLDEVWQTVEHAMTQARHIPQEIEDFSAACKAKAADLHMYHRSKMPFPVTAKYLVEARLY